MKLNDQLADAVLSALNADGITQADLSRSMGLTTKHINHLVHGKSGALGMFDFAAHALGRRWVVTLEPAEAHTERGGGS